MRSDRWRDARKSLDGLPGGNGLNIAYEAVDRHVAHGQGDRVALRWRGRHDEHLDLTYGELKRRTDRFAGVLSQLGYPQGVGVATLLGRIPELYVAALGTLKHRGVFTPLFSAFGPEPIAVRVEIGQIQVLVTSALFYRRKVAAIRSRLASLQHVLIVGGEQRTSTTRP
ncbi:MAG: AMP-binding protein [Acidimicrobiales bacterium]